MRNSLVGEVECCCLPHESVSATDTQYSVANDLVVLVRHLGTLSVTKSESYLPGNISPCRYSAKFRPKCGFGMLTDVTSRAPSSVRTLVTLYSLAVYALTALVSYLFISRPISRLVPHRQDAMECPRSTSSSGSDLDPEIELKCGTCKALKMSQRSTEHLQPSALFDEVEVGVADILEQAESGCTSCRLLIEAIEITLKQPPRNGAKKPAELVRKFSIARPKDAYFSITLLNYEYHSAEFEIITSSGRSPTTRASAVLNLLLDDPSPWKAIPFKPGLGARLDSPSCYETIRAWMARCEQEHPECKQTVHHQLPRRVIRIGQTGAEPPLRLYESQGHEDKEYLALSHCWGDPATVPSLTQATLLPYSQQIPNNILSNTFSDAVEITRKLGYRYIWIDALCIVQDDPEDWAREAAKMARVRIAIGGTLPHLELLLMLLLLH